MNADELRKCVRDGKVAVLYSPGFGAGWSTWGHGNYPQASLCMDADLVEAFEVSLEKLCEVAGQKYPDAYQGGLSQIEIGWVPSGEQFEITEYDGHEDLNIIGQQIYMVA